MKTLTQTLSKVERLENELHLLTRRVGDILQKPASERDASQLASAWREVEEFRPKIRSTGKLLQKIKKPKQNALKGRDYRERHKIFNQARNFKKRLQAWDDIKLTVERHLHPERNPLLSRQNSPEPDPLLNMLYRALYLLANPNSQDQAANKLGCFADLPFPISSFDKLMAAAYRVGLAQNPRRPMRFLDVGCGGGTKVFTARRFFRQADGLEYDQGYVDSARRSLKVMDAPESTIYHADAMTFDAYSEYDVIYFYRPLRDDDLLKKMEQHIMSQTRPGTILVAPYNLSSRGRAGMDCAVVEDPIYVTGLEQTEANQLRTDAEATGTAILKRSTDLNFDAGYWAPILDTASFNADG